MDPPKSKKTNPSSDQISRWDDLNPEVLALVLVRVPAEQRIGNVSLVCKSWLACVAGPFCWADIDLQCWCRRSSRSVFTVDSAVRTLVRRSQGTFHRLSAYRLGDSGFNYLANCGQFLKVLQIPMSDVTDKLVEKHSESLANLTTLDISYCLKITCKGLGSLGKNCKSLVDLKRNMPPPELERHSGAVVSRIDDSEAMVIADSMQGLQHLELGFGRFGDPGLDAILTKCKSLTHLDIRGCWNLKLDGDLEERCMQLQAVTSPWIDDDDNVCSSDSGDDNNWPGSSDESDQD